MPTADTFLIISDHSFFFFFSYLNTTLNACYVIREMLQETLLIILSALQLPPVRYLNAKKSPSATTLLMQGVYIDISCRTADMSVHTEMPNRQNISRGVHFHTEIFLFFSTSPFSSPPYRLHTTTLIASSSTLIFRSFPARSAVTRTALFNGTIMEYVHPGGNSFSTYTLSSPFGCSSLQATARIPTSLDRLSDNQCLFLTQSFTKIVSTSRSTSSVFIGIVDIISKDS